jgi:hypothetical protein
MEVAAGVALASEMSRKSSPDLLSLLANPIIWSIIGFGVGIYLFFRGFALLRRKRFILDIPRSSIRGAALGLVEVSGKAEGPYTILAPLSEEDCFYYRAVVWQGGERTAWRKAAEESLAAPFFLDDGTGKLMVDPRGAQTDIPPVFSEEYSGTPPDYLWHFLSRHGVSLDFPVKLEEYCIRAGDTLFAMGTLRENIDTADPSRGEFLSAEAADLQRRGEIATEMPAVLPQPTHPRAVKPSAEFDLHPPVVLAGNGAEHPLFVSVRSQREIVQALAWQSALYIWGGPILTLVCFWYLLDRLGYL